VGAVNILKAGVGACIEGRDDEVGVDDVVSDFGQEEQGAVGQECEGNGGELFYSVNQFADSRIEGGLTGAGERDVIRVGGEAGFEGFDDVVEGHVFFSLCGFVGGGSELAIDAVIGAGFERDQVDAE